MHGYWLNTNNFSLHHHFRFIKPLPSIDHSGWNWINKIKKQHFAWKLERTESASTLLGTTKIQFQTFAYRGQSLLWLPRYSRHGRRWGCSRSSCHSETVSEFRSVSVVKEAFKYSAPGRCKWPGTWTVRTDCSYPREHTSWSPETPRWRLQHVDMVIDSR